MMRFKVWDKGQVPHAFEKVCARQSLHYSKGGVRQAHKVCPVEMIGLANLRPKPCQRKCSAFHSSPPKSSSLNVWPPTGTADSVESLANQYEWP